MISLAMRQPSMTHFFMPGHVLDISDRVEVGLTSLQGSVTVFNSLAFTNPFGDQRPARHGLNVKTPQYRHEGPQGTCPTAPCLAA